MLVPFVLLAATSAAHAGADRGDPAEQADRIIARLDADHDGKLSPQEVAPAQKLARHFARIDENRDGFVTKAELTTAIARLRERRGTAP